MDVQSFSLSLLKYTESTEFEDLYCQAASAHRQISSPLSSLQEDDHSHLNLRRASKD